MSEKLEQLKNLSVEIEAKYQEACKDAAEVLMEAFKEIFQQFPQLERFSFPCYTDYFNDGDTCYYNVHAEWRLEINDEDESIDELRYDINKKENVHKEWMVEAGDKIIAIVNSVDKEIFNRVFGDHIMIIVTPEGITTEDYTDHD